MRTPNPETTISANLEITSPKIVVEVKSLSVPPTVQLNSEQMQITASGGETSSKSINGNKRKSPPEQLLIPKRSKIETDNSSNSSAESRRKSAVNSSARSQRKIETDNSSGETHTPSITEVWELLNRHTEHMAEFEEFVDKHVQRLVELEDFVGAAIQQKAAFEGYVSRMLLEISEKLKKD